MVHCWSRVNWFMGGRAATTVREWGQRLVDSQGVGVGRQGGKQGESSSATQRPALPQTSQHQAHTTTACAPALRRLPCKSPPPAIAMAVAAVEGSTSKDLWQSSNPPLPLAHKSSPRMKIACQSVCTHLPNASLSLACLSRHTTPLNADLPLHLPSLQPAVRRS